MPSIKSLYFITAIILFTSAQALAGDVVRTPLAYTTMGASQPKTFRTISVQGEPKAVPQQIKAIEPPALTTPAPNAQQQSKKVWQRYKALASGQMTDIEPTPIQRPRAPVKPQAAPQKAGTLSPRATGFAAIIQQYQENKKNRAGIKTRSINTAMNR